MERRANVLEGAPTAVDVGVMNPHIAAGLGRSGAPDVYAQAVHDLARQRRMATIAEQRALRSPKGPEISTEEIENIADRINGMRRPLRGGDPLPFEQIEARLLQEAERQRLPTQVCPFSRVRSGRDGCGRLPEACGHPLRGFVR
jgi:hypothetical protein